MPQTTENRQQDEELLIFSKEELKERLLRFRVIDEHTGCWRTNGYKTIFGRGHITLNSKVYVLHRVSAYVYLNLDITNPKEQSNHKEICLHKDCFNPDHLYVGNQSDNMRDCVDSRRHKETRKTHCSRGHEFTPENTIITIHGWRQCKQCRKINNDKFNGKRKKQYATINQ